MLVLQSTNSIMVLPLKKQNKTNTKISNKPVLTDYCFKLFMLKCKREHLYSSKKRKKKELADSKPVSNTVMKTMHTNNESPCQHI